MRNYVGQTVGSIVLVRLLALSAISVALLSGCGRAAPAKAVPNNPASITRAYFEALRTRDIATARSLDFSPKTFRWSDHRELRGLRNLQIEEPVYHTSAQERREQPGFDRFATIGVRFNRVHTNVIGEPPGSDARFALLGRTAMGKWKLISYGTGP